MYQLFKDCPKCHVRKTPNFAQMAFTLDSKIGDFLDDPKGIAALAELVQELSTNPLVGVIKGMTLKDLLAFPQAKQLGITQDMVKMGLDQVNARLK